MLWRGQNKVSLNLIQKLPLLVTYVSIHLYLVNEYDESAIFQYNVGLGVIVKFIKAALKHRTSNVELRKAQK